MKTVNIPCAYGKMLYDFNDDDTITIRADVPPETIAHGLSQVARFGGQTAYAYSVAEHSVRLSWLLADFGYTPHCQAAALLHDAPECFGIGDMNSMVKKAIDLDRYRELDRAIVEALWANLVPKAGPWIYYDPIVHQYDKWLGHYEAVRFGFSIPPELNFDSLLHRISADQRALEVEYWPASVAYSMWMSAWKRTSL